MTDLINGSDRTPLAGWVLAFVGSRVALGPMSGRKMSPVYEYSVDQVVVPGPGGQPQSITVRQVIPFLSHASIQAIEVPAGTFCVLCESMSAGDRRDLHKGVQNCDELIRQQRAAQAGLVIASAVPRS